MCYSGCNDIMPWVADMDIDVAIEATRSCIELPDAFRTMLTVR